MADLIGQTLGSYQIIEALREGGMAEVYKAYQPSMDRYVAIKVIKSETVQDAMFLQRFLREARAVSRLEHPHILGVHDFGEERGRHYLVMPYMAWGSVKDRMGRGLLALPEVARIIRQVASALAYAHRHGIYHRDVKPSNVLLDEEGNAYLTDFGVAKMMEASVQLTATGVGVGTPAYMSPEQGQGKTADGRSDIYSLGVILYEMVVGHRPYRAETPLAVVFMHVHEPLPIPRRVRPDVPEPVERVILKAMAKDPDDRFQTATEMMEALDAAVQQAEAAKAAQRAAAQPVSRERPEPVRRVAPQPAQHVAPMPVQRVGPRQARPIPRWRTMALWAAPVVVLLLAVILAVWRPWPAPRPPAVRTKAMMGEPTLAPTVLPTNTATQSERKATSTFITTAATAVSTPILAHTEPAVRSIAPAADNPNPPTSPVKLVFIHHSCGDSWLETGDGGLGNQLGANNYYVSDTYYDWGPDDIGSYTDIGQWWDWFRGPNSTGYTQAVYDTDNRHADYARAMADAGGENQIIMFKSCYPNSHLGGKQDDPPPTDSNPLRNEDCTSEHHTVGNAKGIYNDILEYFSTRQDKLFVVITAPPLVQSETDSTYAANARAFNKWLVNDWLGGYPYNNVAVFDYYNVLTSNGGDVNANDLGSEAGNHHRWWNGAVQHIQTVANDFSAYGSDPGDSHPTGAGNQKATGEFVQLLNVFYHRWTAGEGTPVLTATGTPSTATPLPSATATLPTTGDECPAYPPGFTFVGDTKVYSVPDLAEPSPRQWFTDPTFGTCLVRVTDRANDLSLDDTSGGMVNEYSRVQSFSADGSRLLVRGTEGTWYLYDAQTLLPLGELALEVEPRWDPDDPDVLYYSDETRLMSLNVQSGSTIEVHDFAGDFPGQNLVAVWTRHEGRPSRDGRYWGVMAQDQEWETVAFVVYDRQTDQVTIRDVRGLPGVEEGIDHVTISPLANYFLASFDHYCEDGHLGDDANPCGLMVYDQDLTNGRSLLRIIGHYDPALDAQGREVIIYQDIDTDHMSMLDLATGAVTPLWEIDFGYTAIGFHFSGLAFDRPGWALVSTHDDDLITYTWMDDEVFAVELKPGGRVVRLAHTHSLVNDDLELDYWAEPHASVNHDFTRVVFATNWGRSGTGEVEMFMIALPSDWPARLP